MNSQQDIAHTLACRNVGQLSIVAGAGQDGVEQTGPTIDRLTTGAAVTGATQYNSARLDILYTTTLAATKTLSLTAKVQDSADGSSWNTAVVLQAATVVKTGLVTAEKGIASYAINLVPRARYIRILWTADLSAADTDTALLSAQLTMGGATYQPTVDIFQN